MCKHLIISRVNLHMRLDPNKYQVKELWKIPGWNESRIQLLNDWCRQSLRKQTSQNFTFISLWQEGFVSSGGELSNEIKIEIENTGDYDDEPLDYNSLINNTEGKKTLNFSNQIRDKVRDIFDEPILCTCLDADDALHKDFVRIVQDQDWPSKPYYYDVPERYCYNIHSGAKGRKKTRAPSPFATCYEPEIVCYPLRYNHTYLPLKGKKVPGLHALQTVNGSNMYSKGTGQPANFNLNDYR